MGGRLQGKSAIVTGAGKGIGRAIASVFATEGARIIVADIDERSGEIAARELADGGAEAVFIHADISSARDCDNLARATIEHYGRIDVLCQNAGIYPGAPLEDMTEELWDRVLAVNLKGVFLTVKACLPHMISQRSGRIVITSSTTGPRTAIPGQTHYAASKGGVNGFIHNAALELAKYNIAVNGVEPGGIMTAGVAEEFEADYIASLARGIPMGRLGDPEDIAYALLYLASDEAKYVTGQTIVVDGGTTLPEFLSAVP